MRRTFLILISTWITALLPIMTANAQPSTQFIADSFSPPTLVKEPGFMLKPLGPELVDVDYAAYMSSIDHLQATFSRSASWPHANLSMDDAMLDMQTEQRRFEQRESFAYAVLSLYGETELGCVYVYPSNKVGFDAVVRLWVTQEQYDLGFDEELYRWTEGWVQSAWPFQRPGFPGRAVSWDEWELIEDVN